MADTIREILGIERDGAIVTPAREDVEAVLLALQGTVENPVTDFFKGGVWRTMMKLERHVIHDLVANALPAMAEGAYPDTTTEEWIATLARGWYELDRIAAGFARQAITIACDTTHGPYTIAADAVIFLATDGKRYISATGGTLNTSNSLALDVLAESPGAARGLVNALVTSLPGVTVTAAAIDIVSTVPQYGADEETVDALKGRIADRWPDIETVDETDRVEVWVKAASTAVTRVRLDADPTYPGGVLVTIAGVSGAVAGGEVTACQTYVDARQAITDLNTVQNATNAAIDATGSVTVPAARLTEIQAAANAAWIAYLASTQIGDKIFRTELVQAIMDQGAIDCVVALTGAGGDGNVALGSNEVPIAGGDLASQLTWTTVA